MEAISSIWNRVLFSWCPLIDHVHLWRRLALPCFRVTTFVSEIFPEPRPNLCYLSVYRSFGVAPFEVKNKASTINDLSRLIRIPLTIAVYASCIYFYILCKTRFRWVTSPFRIGLFTYLVTQSCFIIHTYNSSAPGLCTAQDFLSHIRNGGDFVDTFLSACRELASER